VRARRRRAYDSTPGPRARGPLERLLALAGVMVDIPKSGRCGVFLQCGRGRCDETRQALTFPGPDFHVSSARLRHSAFSLVRSLRASPAHAGARTHVLGFDRTAPFARRPTSCRYAHHARPGRSLQRGVHRRERTYPARDSRAPRPRVRETRAGAQADGRCDSTHA
jgi:hypothetical protein